MAVRRYISDLPETWYFQWQFKNPNFWGLRRCARKWLGAGCSWARSLRSIRFIGKFYQIWGGLSLLEPHSHPILAKVSKFTWFLLSKWLAVSFFINWVHAFPAFTEFSYENTLKSLLLLTQAVLSRLQVIWRLWSLKRDCDSWHCFSKYLD